MSDNKNPFTRASEIADQKFAEIIARPGRKAKTTVIEPDPIIDQERVGNAMTVMRDDANAMALAENQLSARVRAVAAQVGYQLPSDCADPDMIQRDISVNMRRTAEAMLQIGLGLVCLKEACQHGEFLARLEVLHFDLRAAQRYMQVAKKISNTSTSTHLLKVIDSQSKLLELIVLDDEDLEELAMTGQTGELKLDDVATMSVKELRAKVRELKNEVTAKEDVLTNKAKQINALEEKVSRMKTVPPDDVLPELHAQATKWLNDTLGAIRGTFAAAIGAVDQHHQDNGGDSLAFLAGAIGQVQTELDALRDRYGIPNIAPALIPEWVTDPAFKTIEG